MTLAHVPARAVPFLVACAAACRVPPRADDSVLLPPDAFAGIPFGGEGRIERTGDALVLHAGNPLTGVRCDLPDLPRDDYELSLEATRVRGGDFFCALTFPYRDAHCTLVVGGWGGALVGLSCLDGEDAAHNDTTTYFAFDDGRPYRVTLRVGGGRIRASIDGTRVVDAEVAGRQVSVRADLAATVPLAVCSYATTARIRDVRLRRTDAR
ncbi:MAG TPA: DUF1080 domain-containing protein [Planctomycetota bacterium]|nr:DUF1080 domain-containing protein [Planctomycetota bacterium]